MKTEPMKKIIIPTLALFLLGCDPSTSTPTYNAKKQSKSVERKYKAGDKVLLRLGIEGIVIDTAWGNGNRYVIRVLLRDNQGVATLAGIVFREFEIEKKID